MNLFIITTYNLPNLIISLSALRRYLENNRLEQFALCINNDNPAYTVKQELVDRYLPRELVAKGLIVNPNEGENLGCLGARMKAINKSHEWMIKEGLHFQFYMFIDDDDVVLTPDFNSKKLEISHRAVVTHRLLEVLTLIEQPNPNLKNEYIEFEPWKLGCVGVPYNFQKYWEFIQHLQGFLPQLYKLYGSEVVLEPDDIILMNLWHVWLRHFVNEDLSQLLEEKDKFSYALTFLEDRKGRYDTTKGVVDLRYGEWDGKTTYASIVQPMIDDYEIYCQETKN